MEIVPSTPPNPIKSNEIKFFFFVSEIILFAQRIFFARKSVRKLCKYILGPIS